MDDHTVAGRVVAVLDAVADLGDAATLAALTRSTGIPKPTVRRIAGDLVARNLLERCDDGYRLGQRLLELGLRAAEQHGLRDAATPYIQDLFARTGKSCGSVRSPRRPSRSLTARSAPTGRKNCAAKSGQR